MLPEVMRPMHVKTQHQHLGSAAPDRLLDRKQPRIAATDYSGHLVNSMHRHPGKAISRELRRVQPPPAPVRTYQHVRPRRQLVGIRHRDHLAPTAHRIGHGLGHARTSGEDCERGHLLNVRIHFPSEDSRHMGTAATVSSCNLCIRELSQ